MKTDTPKRPAGVPSGTEFQYLGVVRGAKRDPEAAYGLELVEKGNVKIWKRLKGSWRKIGDSASKTQARRMIARRAGVRED